jgi:hypothetical protein
MLAMHTSALNQEWITLQNNYEQYERHALWIKLISIVLCAVGLTFTLHEVLTAGVILTLWAQEGIFRTYQSRLGARIVRVEGLLKQGESADGIACQLHSEWIASRTNTVGLLCEYAGNMMRPTVVFPYALLVLVNMAFFFTSLR